MGSFGCFLELLLIIVLMLFIFYLSSRIKPSKDPLPHKLPIGKKVFTILILLSVISFYAIFREIEGNSFNDVVAQLERKSFSYGQLQLKYTQMTTQKGFTVKLLNNINISKGDNITLIEIQDMFQRHRRYEILESI